MNHREYSHPFPAKLIIEKERVYVENSNKPHDIGQIDSLNISPYQKNLTLAKFFKEISRMDELGSGIRNITKYAKSYSGGTPLFIEGDIFQTIIPLEKSKSDHASDQVNELEIGELAGRIALQ